MSCDNSSLSRITGPFTRFFIRAGVTIAEAMAGCLRFLRPRLRQDFGSLSGMAMLPFGAAKRWEDGPIEQAMPYSGDHPQQRNGPFEVPGRKPVASHITVCIAGSRLHITPPATSDSSACVSSRWSCCRAASCVPRLRNIGCLPLDGSQSWHGASAIGVTQITLGDRERCRQQQRLATKRLLERYRDMTHYRIYQLDRSNHITAGYSVECEADADAWQTAGANPATAVEVWQGAGRIGRLRAGGPWARLRSRWTAQAVPPLKFRGHHKPERFPEFRITNRLRIMIAW